MHIFAYQHSYDIICQKLLIDFGHFARLKSETYTDGLKIIKKSAKYVQVATLFRYLRGVRSLSFWNFWNFLFTHPS